MNFDEMTLEQIEARKAEIQALVDGNVEGTDFEALSAEVDQLETRKAFLIEEARKADIAAVISGEGEATNITISEERTMSKTLAEVRASQEYVEAFAKYMRDENPAECRALLTDLVQDGQVPVPTFIEDTIKTAWEKNELLSLVKKTYLKGIVKIGFELSATGAVVHTEGAKAPSEEEITIGIVSLTPAMVKKWITISDEVMALKGEAFLRYIYDEITYQIAKKISDDIIALIVAADETASATAVGVPVVEADVITLGTVAEAIAKLSDAANNPVLVMNKSTWASFKAVQYAGNYAVDPFEGLRVIFNNSLPAFDAAEAGDTYVICGDFGVGVQANLPEGDGVIIKFDDISLSEQDLVKVVGREYIAIGLVTDKAIVKIAKEAES